MKLDDKLFKRTRFFAFATVSCLMVGCVETDLIVSDEDLNDYDSPTKIGFMSSTTRAFEANLNTIKGLDSKFPYKGFQVYGYTNDANCWYEDRYDGVSINGMNNYFWRNSGWHWDAPGGGLNIAKAPSWPDTPSDYPMTFFAAFPAYYSSFATIGPNAQVDGKHIIEINNDNVKQKDLMAAWAQVIDKAPSNGKVNLKFKHILSKSNISARVDEGYEIEVLTAKLVNIKDKRFFDYARTLEKDETDADRWTGDFIKEEIDGKSDYVYDTYNYPVKNSIVGYGNNYPFASELNDGGELAVVDGHIMTIPQQLEPVVACKGNIDRTYNSDNLLVRGNGSDPGTMNNGAYVELIYRMYKLNDDGSQIDLLPRVGMSHSSDHPYITNPSIRPEGYQVYLGGIDYDENPEQDLVSDGDTKLYIRVYYPIENRLEMGRGCMYELNMGSTGSGLFMDDTYYDEYLQDTNLPIDLDGEGEINPVSPTDPIVGEDAKLDVSILAIDDSNDVD